jgi:HEAT repeat protein
LLSLLEAAGGAELEDDDRDFEVTLSSDPQQRERELHRLRRLVSAEDYAVRSAALKALVSTRELDNVPTLIFALGDPDSRIVVLANRGLRGLSRRLDGFDMPEEPTEAVKREAIDRWKQWYLMIRPDAQFLN